MLTRDTALCATNTRTVSEHLMIAIAGQNILEFAGCTVRLRATLHSDVILDSFVVIRVTVLAVTFISVGFAAEGVTWVARLRVVMQGVVTIVSADFTLGFEAFPAVQDPVIGGVVIVGVIVKVAGWYVVGHRYQWAEIVDMGLLLESAGSQ